jgi:hypothetical protein
VFGGSILAVGCAALFLVYRSDQPLRLSNVSCTWTPKRDGVKSHGRLSNPSLFPASVQIAVRYTIPGVGRVRSPGSYVSLPPFGTKHWAEEVSTPRKPIRGSITGCTAIVSRDAKPAGD